MKLLMDRISDVGTKCLAIVAGVVCVLLWIAIIWRWKTGS